MSGLSTVVKGTGPALLLVHGAGGSIQANYGPVLGTLTQHFTVIAPDLPGSGGSPKAAGALDLDKLADDLVDIAVRAGHESFFVSGYSMGCAVAVTAAVRHPDRVRGLVLSTPFAKIDAATKAKIDEWKSLLDGSRAVLSRFILSVMCSKEYLARLTPAQAEGFAELIGASVPTGSPAHVDLILKIDLTGLLPRVTQPTLVIGASGDQLLSRELGKEVSDLIPGSKYTDIACGHAIALEAAMPWSRLITDYLTSI
ncbi:Pimeloyl-ACP methyl ester carboxylesterase [Lentzea xinjiangensis]|uniref:Pimeloyl-ACP methyl ester carboxylesterase n=1 Tax=Lentzea xinjiangensis TaxID=402600 RepID=A0A1H9MN05_9PSEU|nr:alpha/beta hydrolase [Lentzea xinjiangensis]SER25094.1 Pimeloyl-ACP methyl ester carboxylesterase [Lentzea xinjiangensis]